MRNLAVFDIDGTIFRNSLFIELFNELVEQNIFPKKAFLEVEEDLKDWINRKNSYNVYTQTLVATFFKYLRGVNVEQIVKVSNVVAKKNKDKVYRYTRELIKQLKSKDYYLIAISGSSKDVVAPFAAFHEFDYFIGAEYTVKNGKYTGELFFDSFTNKAKVLYEFMKSSGLKFNLKKSYAIGDSENDISLLEIVGNPIAFNPSMEFARVAEERKWKIVVERKDVIYEMRDFNLIVI